MTDDLALADLRVWFAALPESEQRRLLEGFSSGILHIPPSPATMAAAASTEATSPTLKIPSLKELEGFLKRHSRMEMDLMSKIRTIQDLEEDLPPPRKPVV